VVLRQPAGEHGLQLCHSLRARGRLSALLLRGGDGAGGEVGAAGGQDVYRESETCEVCVFINYNYIFFLLFFCIFLIDSHLNFIFY
jgi:hypothetical protein